MDKKEIINQIKIENEKVQSMHGTFSKDFLKGYASCYQDILTILKEEQPEERQSENCADCYYLKHTDKKIKYPPTEKTKIKLSKYNTSTERQSFLEGMLFVADYSEINK